MIMIMVVITLVTKDVLHISTTRSLSLILIMANKVVQKSSLDNEVNYYFKLR